jgi:hypothetical protein
MNDLHNRFRSLDDVPAPDLWREAENRAQALQHGGRTLSLALVALLLLLTLAVGTAALIGSGVIKFPALVVDASATPNEGTPYPSATSEQDLLLGGGLMLVHSFPPDSATDTFDVFTLDAGTGRQTLLGTLPNLGTYNFQWGTDRKHVLIIGNAGLTPLGNQTDAGRQLTFICCELPEEPVALPSGVGKPGVTVAPAGGWVLSPQSDRIAGLHERLLNLPGCLMCSTADAVVIMDGDGRNLRTLPLPQGTQVDSPISWSPDGSAVLVSGCRPCNNALYASPGGLATDPRKLTPTAVEHAHLYIVPVDGSPVQELLDETETRFFSPAWSPDGTTMAFSSYVCGSAEHAPYCGRGSGTLEKLVVAEGQRAVLAKRADTGLVWSPDGRRLAFTGDDGIFVMDADGTHLARLTNGQEPRWSPDGQWLLFSIHGQGLGAPIIPWIVQVDGGEPRLLGPYGGWAW